jgi:DNA-binding NarL/FixJ family response regulator
MRVVIDAFEGIANVATALNQPVLTARLFGATAALREAVGTTILLAVDRAAHDRATAAARQALGDDVFAAAVAAGRTLTPEQAIAEVVAFVAPPVATPTSEPADRVHFTEREAEVLRLLVAGHPDRAIAEALYLSVRTVENHVARIFAKLGVRTRTAAATAAITGGLVDPGVPPSA